ncbi:Txe/YoeB family addiction module toxin [Vibrio splendidus]|uniref:Txe/YoeB family addiction module toxin n=1 Tax=Vibrio splendidus TaxID=29497 RepID=UPI001F539151|nr:Txe/YoeB family addiction module toxin [Vibrio splendidus]
MASFVVFNELSLPISDNNWKEEMKSYNESINKLKEIGINNIRVQSHFRDIPEFTETRSFVEFFNQIPRQFQTRVRSMIANETSIYVSPLVSEEEAQQHEELTINSEFYFEGNVVKGGLACAHIWNTLTLSFPTQDTWLKERISILKEHVEEGETEVVIPNISSLDSCNSHSCALDTLVGEVKTPIQLCQLAEIQNSLYRYKITFTEEAKTHIDNLYNQSEDLIVRFSKILKSVKVNPDEGIGKPERLKRNLSGFSSRRITDEHRIVYKIIDENLISVTRCQGHYDD